MKLQAERINNLINTKFVPKYSGKNVCYKCYAAKTGSLYIEVSTMVNDTKYAVNQRYSNHISKHFPYRRSRRYYKKNKIQNVERKLEKMTQQILNIRVRALAEDAVKKLEQT